MNKAYYMNYSKVLNENIERIKQCNTKEEIECKRKSWPDPDKLAIRTEFGIKCTADGLISINDIYKYEDFEKIAETYGKYRKVPIIFFPSEPGGINTSRSLVYGNRIDYALFDIKMFLSKGNNERKKCKLTHCFERRESNAENPLHSTNNWIRKGNMDSFEKMIDWWDVKGIFTDDEYNVYDISSKEHKIITDFNQMGSKGDGERDFYNNLKKCIEDWYERQGIEL